MLRFPGRLPPTREPLSTCFERSSGWKEWSQLTLNTSETMLSFFPKPGSLETRFLCVQHPADSEIRRPCLYSAF